MMMETKCLRFKTYQEAVFHMGLIQDVQGFEAMDRDWGRGNYQDEEVHHVVSWHPIEGAWRFDRPAQVGSCLATSTSSLLASS